jgi:hypothetical protein
MFRREPFERAEYHGFFAQTKMSCVGRRVPVNSRFVGTPMSAVGQIRPSWPRERRSYRRPVCLSKRAHQEAGGYAPCGLGGSARRRYFE